MVPPRIPKRDQILEAAGRLFADRGLRDTKIRDIVKAAGVNLAAVNYYFRDKKTLYVEVLRHAAEVALNKAPPDGGVASSAPPEERLLGVVEAIVTCHWEVDRTAWASRLMAREFESPSPPFLSMCDEWMSIYFPLVQGIVADLNGCLDEDQRWWCAHSVMTLAHAIVHDEVWLRHYCSGWHELTKLEQRQLLTRRIFEFCRAAIKGFA